MICAYQGPTEKNPHEGCEYCREQEQEPAGIEKLYSGQQVSLIPEGNNRYSRRELFKDEPQLELEWEDELAWQ